MFRMLLSFVRKPLADDLVRLIDAVPLDTDGAKFKALLVAAVYRYLKVAPPTL